VRAIKRLLEELKADNEVKKKNKREEARRIAEGRGLDGNTAVRISELDSQTRQADYFIERLEAAIDHEETIGRRGKNV